MTTAARLQSLRAIKRLKALYVRRYAAVTKETLEALPAQDSLELRGESSQGMLTTEWDVLRTLQWLQELRKEQYGSYDKSDRLTTVTLDHGDQIFALESEVDGLRAALEALRQAHPGLVIDSDPNWFDQRRGEMRDPKLPGQP